MLDQVQETIKKYNLLETGDKVVVAISGGPDSVCLLHVLSRLKAAYKLEIYGAHLNHNFRGMDAQMDAQYVANFCEQLNILCFVKSMDVLGYAEKNGLSSEEAGRVLRYEFFEEIGQKVGASKIAVAHNQNDQAETVLMRLLRGTGIQGLTAIRHKRDKIIRPLLETDRGKIEDYCETYELSPRIDQTNSQPIYHRNKIRLELIPYLKENYNPNIIEGLHRTAEILKLDNEYMEEETKRAFEQVCFSQGEHCLELSVKGITPLHLSLKNRLIRYTIERLIGSGENFEYKHIQSVLHLLENETTGKEVHLPQGLIVKKGYETLRFAIQGAEINQEQENFSYFVTGESVTIPEIEGYFSVRILKKEEVKEISRDKYLKYFDYDQVKAQLLIRNRMDGDRFYPLGLTGSKKLKDFLIDYKIPREERNRIPLLCDGDEIMWVVGYRISEKYKITNETTRIIAVEFKKIEEPR
ncbi:tRNA(Ile)-lysidine synthetase [Alkaliphilus metalliredigens QYMF]|uniref:tRNA(Ile)-lysidine synthase n=1 Tax=Alkaliphilus metalliredigens (strain QYMF) TaxID=293826 RepID=A6TWP8_ALKMQ|nr:tRNA lysidine(34) synthetase TilS [Alkaliphilus metalliredigens]ABR50616.1 tRNA(Ile)-lysidine synthetase [Alkaliphilus metalliredigens QYMF]